MMTDRPLVVESLCSPDDDEPPMDYALTGQAQEYFNDLRELERESLQELRRLAAVIGPTLSKDEQVMLYRTCGGKFASSLYRVHQLDIGATLEQMQLIKTCDPTGVHLPRIEYRRTLLGNMVASYNEDDECSEEEEGQHG